jgi:hypothetical protein
VCGSWYAPFSRIPSLFSHYMQRASDYSSCFTHLNSSFRPSTQRSFTCYESGISLTLSRPPLCLRLIMASEIITLILERRLGIS